MAQPLHFDEVFPIFKVENDCLLSKQGDVTVAFEVSLPEIYTLSDQDYEAFHQVLIKALKLLPKHSVFHKQDWFTSRRHQAHFDQDLSPLSQASERFFNERPYLDHSCYIMITMKPANRKQATSTMTNLLRKSLVPEETLSPQRMQEFHDAAAQFQRIMQDSGFMKLKRLTTDQLAGTEDSPGLLERYCFLLDPGDEPVIRDIHFKDGLQVGDQHCQLFTLADVEDLPAACGSRITYDRYSTDKTKFSIGFASPLGQLLNCNHVYNQFIFVDDAAKTIKQLESKRLRLQSLSAYSRENAIARDSVNDFLNEAIASQRTPIKAHFNVMVWTDNRTELKELRTQVSSAMSSMDATARQEVDGVPQIFWAGLPGNEADFPINDTFDTFCEQAACFFTLETNYRSSSGPIGIRLGDRLTGRPVHVDISDEPVKRGIITNRNKFILGPSGGVAGPL